MSSATLTEQRALAAAGFDPGPIDGVEGPRTRRARSAFRAAQLGVSAKASDPAGAKIYAEAIKYRGVHEVPGSQSDPTIAEMFALAPDWLDQDDSKTAWCGLFRGYVGQKTGTGLPKDHYRAASWLEWGNPVKLEDAKRGDTVVFTRPGGNHVAIVDEYNGGEHISVLGGNQGNAVSITSFPVSSIRGIRRG